MADPFWTLVQHLEFQVVLVVPLDYFIDLPGIDLLTALPAAVRTQSLFVALKYIPKYCSQTKFAEWALWFSVRFSFKNIST